MLVPIEGEVNGMLGPTFGNISLMGHVGQDVIDASTRAERGCPSKVDFLKESGDDG